MAHHPLLSLGTGVRLEWAANAVGRLHQRLVAGIPEHVTQVEGPASIEVAKSLR
jgi:hypothetical protein